MPVVSAHSRAPLSGYRVRIHVPEAVFQAPLRAALLQAAGAGAVLLAASLALALLLARQIAASLRFLAPGVSPPSLGEAERGPEAGSGLREVDELAAALERASAQRDTALAELQLLHASSPVGMAHTDTGGRIQAANDAFLRLVGLSATDLGAGTMRWDSLTPPEWLARDEAAIAEAVDWGYCRPYEKEFLRPDGGRVPVLVAFGLLDRATGKCATFAVDLSDRKRAEAALAESQERLALAQEAGGIGLWDLETASGDMTTTPTWRALHGLSVAAADDLTLDDWLGFVVGADRARVTREFRAVAAGGALRSEFRVVRRDDGAVRWVKARARRLANGNAGHLVGTVWDITERREAEAALRRQSAMLRALVDSDVVGIVVATGSVIEEANDHFLRLVGRTRPELEAGVIDWATITPEEHRAADGAMMRRMGDTGSSYAYETKYLRPDGTRVPVLLGGALIDRATLHRIVFVVDLTERDRAQAAADASAAMLRSIMDTTTDCVKVLDAAGRFHFANGVACRNLGVGDPAELADRSWFDLWEHGEAVAARQAVAEALAGRMARFQGAMRNTAGHMACWDAVVRRIPGTDRVLVVSRDSTADQAQAQAQASAKAELERLVAERTRALTDTAAELAAEMERREKAQAALVQSQKLEALGQLTGSVAHDFNNILAAVQGSYRLMERRVADPEVLGLIRHGKHAAGRAAKLIGQLMAFARREDLQPALTEVAEAIGDAEDMICHVAGRMVSCKLEVAAGTWPVIVDPVRLETVLLNLAANARDAMPDGGAITLTARNARAEELPPGAAAWRDHVLIAMTDTGAGMDPETLQRATEPFFTTKPPGQGTGLGLASAHAFAQQSSGALSLASSPGEGTTVTLFLPRADILPGGSGRENAADPSAILDPARHGGATLLVVEDDAAVRAVTAAMLRDLGYRVIEAPSAEAAEALAHVDGGMDMLVTDVVLGGAPGPLLVGRLRSERPDLPALYLTGQASGPWTDGVPVLRKPYTEEALARAVLKGLGRLSDEDRPPQATLPGTDRLRERLQQPELREAYMAWMAVRGARIETLPATDAFRFGALSDKASASAYLAEVLENGTGGFRFLRAGRALEDRLGRPLIGTVVGGAGGEIDGALGGSISAVYRRCVLTRAPSYDYARFALGDGRPVLLERLILPLSGNGTSVTHVAGVAVFAELELPCEDDLD